MKIHSIRAFLLFIFSLLLLFIIWFYIGILQLYHYQYYREKSIHNCTRYQKINGLRGIITDCHGEPIAITQPIFQFIWHKYPKKLSEEDIAVIKFLEEIRNKKIDLLELSLKNEENEFIICNNVSFSELSLFFEHFPTNKRVTINNILTRNYPQKDLFAHVIGYLHKTDKQGLFGIEKLCDIILTGKEGLIEKTVNAKGTVLEKKILIDAQSGKTIQTTLDYKIQKILADAFPENSSGCGIIINGNTGAIKALYSAPTFDPHLFSSSISQDDWQTIIKSNALINRAFQAQYPPGSLYKLIIALALLEEKIITPDTQWFCCGKINYKGRNYHCSNKHGHGIISIDEAIAQSCNIPFYSAAINGLSIDTIYKYAKNFGLGEKTGIFFNEMSGLIPNKIWKKKKYGESWYQGETLSACIGQGATTVTPIQIAQIIMGIMHGYIIPPYILGEEKKDKIYLPYKKENLRIIQDSMKTATASGSSKLLNTLKGWQIYGKTGTAQVCSLLPPEDRQENIEKEKEHHGLFACYAQYKDKEPIIIVLVIEHNRSSRNTVFIAKKILQEYEKIY